MTNMKNDADRRTIYGRFAAMARRHPDAVAIIEDGRRLPDRGFAFLRRNDDQVMILGRRVETGEVENVLNESPDVAPVAWCAISRIPKGWPIWWPISCRNTGAGRSGSVRWPT